MSSICVWLQIIFCSFVNETTIVFFLAIALGWKWLIASNPWEYWLPVKNKHGDRMIKQLLNSVITPCQCLADQLFPSAEITDLLATDKSRYFAQAPPIIVNSLCSGFFKGKPEEILFFRSDVLRVKFCVNITSKQCFLYLAVARYLALVLRL